MSNSNKKDNTIKPPDWLRKDWTKEELQAAKDSFREAEFDHDFFVVSQEAFFGLIFSRITKVPDWGCGTAYIGARREEGGNTHVQMGYNPLFFRSLTSVERRGVIRHEMYHMILNHIFERGIGDLRYAKLANIAYDLAVNSLIPAHKLPKMVLRPGTRPIDPETNEPVSNPYTDFITTAPLEQSFDWYFRELKKILQEQSKGDSLEGIQEMEVTIGVGSMDDHDDWGSLDPDLAEEIKDRVKELLRESLVEAERSNNWGDIPKSMQEEIRRILSKEINWKSVIKNFVGRVRTTERSSTLKRINKKMPYVHPGVKRKTVAKFACFIDQSGSMSDQDIAMLFNELEGLAKNVDIDVFYFDTEIDFKSHFLWKKGKSIPTLKRTRCGGTDFSCVAKLLNDRNNKDFPGANWSGAFILTDGYANTMRATPRSKVMWVITEGGTKKAVRSGDLVVKMKSDKGSFSKK